MREWGLGRFDMRKSILILLLACLPFLYLASCGGGDGNGGEEFTVFDVTIRVLEVESRIGSPTDCPERANLKLSLLINGNNISGFAELIGFGKVGDASAISGQIVDNEFTLEPFRVAVTGDLPPDPFFPASGILFDFQQFQGVFVEESEVIDNIEGENSGTVFENSLDAVICDANFSGEFSGISRSPDGCFSPVEAPTLECPAEGFINMCDAFADFFCFGWCEPLDDGVICVDFGFLASECEIIDCLTVSCPGIGLVNFEGLEDYGSFQVIIGPHTVPCG
jgi:hypothetical protein